MNKMRKSLIKLAAVVVFAPAAYAQSGVTLYGIVDVGYLYTKPDTGSSLSEIADTIQAAPRFGIRGTESLGAGFTAGFDLPAARAGRMSRRIDPSEDKQD